MNFIEILFKGVNSVQLRPIVMRMKMRMNKCYQKNYRKMYFTKFDNLSRIIQHGNHLKISNDSLSNKKYVCKQIIRDWNNLLFFICYVFFGSSAQLRLISFVSFNFPRFTTTVKETSLLPPPMCL